MTPSAGSRILIVEDNTDLARGLASNLEIEGYAVHVASDGQSGLDAAKELQPHLIILDLMLPDVDGVEVLSSLRQDGNAAPVLILSARNEEIDKVRGFRHGADDYVTKPFGLLELLARVEALLRRANSGARREPGSERVRFGDVEIAPGTHEVFRRGYPVMLRPKEYELLMLLVRRQGELISRLDLLRDVWGYEADVVSRTLDTHIAELRRKLEDDPASPRHILTVRKAGYRLSHD